MSTVVYVLQTALALGLIIFVHELGHFLAAKFFGVKVTRFGFGLPFTQPVLKITRGETEYGLYPVLVGGFVDLVGDHADSEGGDDPHALWRKPAWQRIIIMAAGVTMNGLLAIVLFAVASLVGMKAVSPMAGGVVPSMPAAVAGMLAGDRIVAIDGEPVQAFDDIITTIASSDAGTAFMLTVQRPREGAEPETLTLGPIHSVRQEGSLAPMLGIEPAQEPVIGALITGYPETQAGLMVGDRILAVNGREVTHFRQTQDALKSAPDGPVTLLIERDGEQLTLTADPAVLWTPHLGMTPPTVAAAVSPGSPAQRAGLKAGDVLARAGDVRWPTSEQLIEAVKTAGPGGKVTLSVLRDGEALDIVCEPKADADDGVPRIGLLMSADPRGPVRVGEVETDGPAAAAGLEPGDVVESVTQGDAALTPKTWDDLLAVFAQAGGKPVPLVVRRGETTQTALVTAARKPVERFTLLSSQPAGPFYEDLPRIYNPATAVARGMKQTWTWLGRIYINLLQLVRGEVSTRSVGGPVLIVQSSLGIATRGVGTFIHFWGILSICVAVFNFLPVPPFDGGQVVFILAEKLKGGPISLRVRTWVWGASWVAVLALFVLVTWQDIARLL